MFSQCAAFIFIDMVHPDIPIALIEAKDNSHSVGDGLAGLDRGRGRPARL
jgi:hypothetical protein